MLPDFDQNGNLPPGIHWANRKSFGARFGTTPHRRRLMEGLYTAIELLRAAGCKTIFVDGSFVTSKEVPGDFDACWDPVGVDPFALLGIEPVFFSFQNGRAAQKAKFGGEFFPALEMLDFFQTDREGNKKGIVALDLRRWGDDQE